MGAVIYRELNWQHLRRAIIDGGISTAAGIIRVVPIVMPPLHIAAR